MHRASFLVLSLAPALFAQTPCAPPAPTPGTFLTLLAGTTFLGTPDPVMGANMLFDLVVNTNLLVSRIDVNLLDDGTAPVTPVPPNLVNMTTSLRFWTTPNTWVGNETTPALWTQVASGTLTVQPPGIFSPAVFNPPFLLLAGTHGVALQHMPVPNQGPVHPFYTDPARNPQPLVWPGTHMTLTAGAAQNVAFTGGVALPRIVNIQITYVPSQDSAMTRTFGTGCYRTQPTFYEVFPVPPATFDLGNSVIRMANQGAGYLVTSAPLAWFPPVSPSLTLTPPAQTATPAAPWDDGLSAPRTLPFTFPYPGGSTSQVVICSNGCVFLQPSNNPAAFGGPGGGTSGLLTDMPRLAPFWGDLDANAAGSIHFDVVGQTAYVTWLNVPEVNSPQTTSSFQVAISSNGTVEYRYQTCAITAAGVLTGWSPGNNATDPTGRDLSASLPFVAADGSPPLALNLSARPILGTTVNLVTSDIRTGSVIGFLFLGFGAIPSGIDLTGFGMPDCRQYINPAVSNLFVATGPIATTPWALPGAANLVGIQITGQSAALASGLNNAGILTSNGLCLRTGLF